MGMNRNVSKSGRIALLGLLILCTVMTGITFGANIDVHLVAEQTTVTMPDGRVVPIWGFRLFSDPPGSATIPGPTITAEQGDTLTIQLTNRLPATAEHVSIIIPGQQATEAGAMVPVWTDGSSGARFANPLIPAPAEYDKRVRSFTHEAVPNGTDPADTVAYEWASLEAGTYLVQSGTHPSVQIPMGLYAVLKVDDTAGVQAYNDGGTAYDSEVVLAFSELDPDLNDAVAGGSYGTAAYPTSIGYKPRYFLINGEPFSYSLPPLYAGSPGDTILVRMVNAGLDYRVPVAEDLMMTVIAEDGNLAPFFHEQYSVVLSPGKTRDVLITSAPQRYIRIYDRRMGLTNWAGTPGGMLAFLGVGSNVPTTVNVTKTGSHTGVVTSVPGGIDCGLDCSGEYVSGPEVTLRATPDTGMLFAGWSGACSNNPTWLEACMVATPGGVQEVTAIFGPTPNNDPTEFVKQLFRDFYGREGTPGEVQPLADALIAGSMNRRQVVKTFFDSPEFRNVMAPVIRLYSAYFLRLPDFGGLMFWRDKLATGAMTLGAISNFFAGSVEFQNTYGALNNADFVTLVYNNVLQRAPEPTGLAFWTGKLDSGALTRGQVMIGFSESVEYINNTANTVDVTMAYAALLRRVPQQAELTFWTGHLSGGGSIMSLIETIITSREYALRF